MAADTDLDWRRTSPTAVVIFLGRDHIFPWLAEPTPARGAWLTVGFVFWRDLLALLLLFGLSIAFVWQDLKPDVAQLASERGSIEFELAHPLFQRDDAIRGAVLRRLRLR